jgi:hypothetical protein
MKKISFTIILLFLITFTSYSQQGINTMIDLGDLAVKTTHSHNEWLDLGKNSSIQGSMYLFEDFRPGSIVLKSDTLIEGIKFRYNIRSKQMEMSLNKDTLAFIRPDKARFVNFDHKTFIFTTFEEDNKTGMDYFQVIADGNAKLLLHYDVVFIPKNPPVTPYSAGNPNDQYVQFKNYFSQKGDRPAIPMSKKQKNILKLFSDKKVEIAKYIEEKNLKTSREADLVELFRYYNSLK